MQNPHCLRCRDDGIYMKDGEERARICSCPKGAEYHDEIVRGGGSIDPARIDKETLH